MFPLVSAATILPILFLAFFALDSYALILVGGSSSASPAPRSRWACRS